MNVVSRTFRFFVSTSFWLSLAGVLPDADHFWSLVMGGDPRYFHHLSHENPVVFGAYCMCWGLIVWAFSIGWIDRIEDGMEE